MPNQAQERFNVGDCLWFQKMQNYLNFTEVQFGAFFTSHMAQKCDIFFNKTTFTQVQFQVHFSEFEKHNIQMLEMFLPTSLCTLKSSTNTFKNLSPNSLKTSDIVLVKVMVTFLKPNGMTVQSYNLVLVINVVFFISSGAIQICQKPNYKSNAVNQDDFPNQVITLSTSGIGNESRRICMLNGQ